MIDRADRQPKISLSDVTFSYGRAQAVCNASLDIFERDFAWVVGPNGGGKSTLLKLMVGLLQPDSGVIRIDGQPPARRRRSIGYMPQSSRLDPRFPIDAQGVVLTGLATQRYPKGPFGRSSRELALDSLAAVGLADEARTHFAALSIGQQRRLLIARALVGRPEILFLDEPTANLDIRVEEDLYRLLEELNRELTIVMVSHDPAFVSPFVKSVVCVNRVVHVHPTAELDHHILSELYGRPVRLVRHDRHATFGGES